MRHFVCGLAVVLACGVARADEGEDAAAKWAESVEGRVVRDAKAAGKPVVEVAFGPANKKVTDDGLKELKAFKHLKNLSFFFCENITDAGMKHVKELTTLETLSLTNTGVADDGIAELKGLKNLKTLYTAGSIFMTDKSAKTIGTFANLESLTLPSTITPKGVKDLAGLKKLKSLYIGGATLSDEAVKDIADNMPQLEGLNLGTLAGNGLTDESVPHLARLKKLKTLSIIGAKLTDTGLKSLQKALPDCTITTR
jgi:hypothetical protein